MHINNLAIILRLVKDSMAGEESGIAALECRSSKISSICILRTSVDDELFESSVDILVGGGKLIDLPWIEAALDCWAGSRSMRKVL